MTPEDPLDPTLVLFANDAFYSAFNRRDVGAMRDVWASTHAVYCLHPGWPTLFGREAVLESWARILENPQAPTIACYGARVVSYGACAAVLCYEQLPGGVCVASNGFVVEDGVAKMVWHQAGRCDAPPANTDAAPNWQ